MKPISFAVLIIHLPFISLAQSANNKWQSSAAVYYYFVPGEKIPPTLTAFTDNKSLHFETRYNYENKNSLSAFAGWNFDKQSGNLAITATPMAGIVIGNSNGILPGFEFTASYKFLNFYSENEYMLNLKGKDNNFFYSWTEINALIVKNIKAGVLAQSLRWYNTKFDVQRGIYAEYSLGKFTLDFYYFNPFTRFNFAMAAASLEF